MAVLTNRYSLSALTPVKFTYKFNKEEKLSNNLTSLTNGFSFYTHNFLLSAKDVVLSNHNLLILTDQISLKNTFKENLSHVNVGNIAGSLYLKNTNNKFVTSIRNNIYVGGTGAPLLITVVPIEGNIVELIVDHTKRIMIDEEYPYTAKISADELTKDKLYRQRFEMDLKDGKCCFKATTKEGFRFLSHGIDGVLRAIGVCLNEHIVNQYLFTSVFLTQDSIDVGYEARTSEIKYYNELASFFNQKTVNIKTELESNTHLLASCATENITNETPINIALTKTNFSSSGSYSTKQTL